MAPRPTLIGVAGPSCSGKTTLARALAASLPGANAVLSLDSYYRDFARLPPEEQAGFSFDAPTAIDHDLFVSQVRALAQGRAVERPVYDFATHTRAARAALLVPGDHLVVEGLFALYWPEVRRLYHAAFFVDADDDLCLERRLRRDLTERGRSRESVVAQYQTQVRPMFRQYILPTRCGADLVVDGAAPPAESVQAMLAHVQSLSRSRPRRR